MKSTVILFSYILFLGMSFSRSFAASPVAGSGNYLDFDGVNEYVRVPHNSALAPTTGITIEFWAYHSNWSSLNACDILGKYVGGITGGYTIHFYNSYLTT